jgi:ASC-1-like (ASCH) protein
MIKINTTGTTEMGDGRTISLGHTFYVADDAVELLVAGACKVGWRPSGRKITGLKAGDTVICNVTNVNGKLRYETVDEKAARRAEIMEKLISGQHNEEEMLDLIIELKSI